MTVYKQKNPKLDARGFLMLTLFCYATGSSVVAATRISAHGV